MTTILVTGGKGQLASCIREVANDEKELSFIYVDYDELDITKEDEVKHFFKRKDINFCVNCAAYTAVDKAESEAAMARKINVDGARYLAEACKEHKAKLIQISTDFVFDGKQSVPYKEGMAVNPLGIYGSTKLNGEVAVADALKEHFIIRTSWLYSNYGHNFMKTMLRLGEERNTLNVVYDQVGTPTYGIDLARVVVNIIQKNTDKYGTYHYSNEGVASWYDFAKAIFDIKNSNCQVLPVGSVAYPTPAERPAFSVMDKAKIKDQLGLEIPYWRDSLKKCLQNK